MKDVHLLAKEIFQSKICISAWQTAFSLTVATKKIIMKCHVLKPCQVPPEALPLPPPTCSEPCDKLPAR